MQRPGVLRTSRAGRLAGGCCFLLLALAGSSGAYAQDVPVATTPPPAPGGLFDTGPFAAFAGPAAGPGGILGQQMTAAPIVDTRQFSVVPMAGLQETFTDNVFLTPNNKKVDLITRPIVGADMNYRGGPATASLVGHAYYDFYASHGSLSGWGGDALATGDYQLIPNFLSIEADGTVTNGNVTSFGVPAFDRVGPRNRVQIATYDVGPHLTTAVDDFADLNVIGRVAQVQFLNANGLARGFPTGATILEGSASLDTANRFVGYESITQSNVVKTDQNFEAYNGEESLFVRIFPQLRIVGRGGYDNVTEPGIVNISAPMWSGGVQLSINRQSHFTIERGERYNHTAWAGDLLLQISDALYAEGNYFEALEPQQVQINNAFLGFAAPATPAPIQFAPSVFTVNGNLDNQTSLAKIATFRLVYQWERQQIQFNATWNNRLLIVTNRRDQNVQGGVTYLRSIRPDLAMVVGVDYWRTLKNPYYLPSDLYRVNVSLQYIVNPSMQLIGGYAYQHQAELTTGGPTITENILYAAVGRTF